MEPCAEDKNNIRNKTKEHTETLDHCVMIQLLQESGCASALVLSFNSVHFLHKGNWNSATHKKTSQQELGVDKKTKMEANFHIKLHKELMQSIKWIEFELNQFKINSDTNTGLLWFL